MHEVPLIPETCQAGPPESGQTFQNPMRVIPNGEGSECIFTLFRQAPMSDEEFAKDKATIERDLKTLKTLLEKSH